MTRILSILLLSSTAYSLGASMIMAQDSKVYIYEKPSKKSKLVGSLQKRYLRLSLAEEETFIRGDAYSWYKVYGGWVNVSWVINDRKKPLPYTADPFHKKSIEKVHKIVTLTSIKSTTAKTMDKALVQDKDKEVLVPSENNATLVEEDYNEQHDKPYKQKDSYLSRYFVGMSLNYNMLTVDKKDQVGSIILKNTPDDSATSIGLEAGTKISNYIVSANYEMVNLADMSMNSFYLSLDYQFENIVHPFIGVSLGMSNLAWQIDPLGNSRVKDSKLSSLLYGLEMGIEYKLIDHWSLTSTLIYQKLNFTTKLVSSPAESDIVHRDKSSLGVGVRYKF